MKDKTEWDSHACLSHLASDASTPSERAQEVQEILLLLRAQAAEEVVDDDVGFRARTGVFSNGIEEIGGTAIVQEENTLTEAPERRRTELVWTSSALRDAVRKI